MTIVLKELENSNRYGRVKIDEDIKLLVLKKRKPGIKRLCQCRDLSDKMSLLIVVKEQAGYIS
jgi:hypothetical protein